MSYLNNDTRKGSALLASFLLGVVLLFLAGCGDAPRDTTHLSGATMGTTYNISLVAVLTPTQEQELQGAVDKQLRLINQSMSTYIEDSELSTLNRSAPGSWQTISNDLFQVLVLSQDVTKLSQGGFDITVGPLVNRWGFGPDFSITQIPTEQEINELRQSVGAQHVLLQTDTRQVKRAKPVYIDLSAVAKGYGVDKLAELLLEKGYNDFLVEIGGEIRVSGTNKHAKPWRIGIETPVASLEKLVQKAVSLSNTSIATSGDYRNFFELEGQRYSHTIDPRTGYPVQHNLVSVTVLDPLCARADALATAFNVMGYEKALLLANSHKIPAFFIIHTESGFKEFSSDAFKAEVPL